MKINEFMKKRKILIVVVCVVLIAALLGLHTAISANILSEQEDDNFVSTSNINPRYAEIMQRGSQALTQDTSAMALNTVTSSTPSTKAPTTAGTTAATASTKATAKATTATTRNNDTNTDAATVPQQEIPFATAAIPETPASYSDQWDLGYLIAVDNPDTSYACAKITLTDEDRDLLERLCMGEFGTGGFIGASLIAQCVKDSMSFEGFTSVAEVIRENRYDGSTEVGTNEECRQAVRYIFDENHDAVQHRILYMYNPYLVQSSFHESQNFILSYAGVRFFDSWA